MGKKNLNMSNIVIAPAIGMPPQEVILFLSSLRKYYNDEILFFVNKTDVELKKTLKKFNCDYKEVTTHKHDIIIKRYTLVLDFLNNRKDIKNIFFCDSRDIYFQSNPFDFSYEGSLNFFSEDTPIQNCNINSNWMQKTLGPQIFEKLKKNSIICCGTVIGKKDAFLEYAKQMNSMSKKYPYKKRLKFLLTFRRDKEGRGCDQSYAAYLIYNNILKDFKTYGNKVGPFATVYHLDKINFNKDNVLLNENAKPYILVHQYDKKWNIFKDKVELLKKKMNIKI
ncbi:MAG: hypothetical protein CBD76_03105 [Pelagibacteraceae bacterium TMED216]|nr:MAG: hypothetical protein CBD76_03105 [Pelagibacteraceae bacterium TMED216]